MLKINKKVEYALMALKLMSEKPEGELTTVRELCETLDLPFDPVSKVMQALNSSGILSSLKGVKGGYQLSRDLAEISYQELTLIIEGKGPGSHCSGKDTPCERHESCIIKGSMAALSDALSDQLQKITLKDLFHKKTSKA